MMRPVPPHMAEAQLAHTLARDIANGIGMSVEEIVEFVHGPDPEDEDHEPVKPGEGQQLIHSAVSAVCCPDHFQEVLTLAVIKLLAQLVSARLGHVNMVELERDVIRRFMLEMVTETAEQQKLLDEHPELRPEKTIDTRPAAN